MGYYALRRLCTPYNNNVDVIDNQNYLLFDNVVAGRETVNRYDVTQVRPNNGKIEGTTSQNAQ